MFSVTGLMCPHALCALLSFKFPSGLVNSKCSSPVWDMQINFSQAWQFFTWCDFSKAMSLMVVQFMMFHKAKEGREQLSHLFCSFSAKIWESLLKRKSHSQCTSHHSSIKSFTSVQEHHVTELFLFDAVLIIFFVLGKMSVKQGVDFLRSFFSECCHCCKWIFFL